MFSYRCYRLFSFFCVVFLYCLPFVGELKIIRSFFRRSLQATGLRTTFRSIRTSTIYRAMPRTNTLKLSRTILTIRCPLEQRYSGATRATSLIWSPCKTLWDTTVRIWVGSVELCTGWDKKSDAVLGEVYRPRVLLITRVKRGFHPTQRTQRTQRTERKARNALTSLLDRPITAASDDGVCRSHAASCGRHGVKYEVIEIKFHLHRKLHKFFSRPKFSLENCPVVAAL